MLTATVHLESATPLCMSKYVSVPKLEKEGPDDYEKRTWRERVHADENGEVFIPPMALKFSLTESAQFSGEKIKGRGQATWTRHFEAGVLVPEPVRLGIKKDDVQGQWLLMNADGKRGSGTRVMRCIPIIPAWKGVATYYILDPTITKEVFERTLRQAGLLIGIGQFRPRRGGYCGRYSAKKIEWSNGTE